MNSLTEKQRSQHLQTKKRLGFEETEHSQPAAIKTNDPSVTILSGDPSESSFVPKIIQLNSAAHLKESIGRADHENDEHIEYPTPMECLAGAAAKNALTTEHIQHLKQAAHAYTFGNTSKVHDDLKEHINTFLFPGTLAAFSFADYTVKNGETLTLKDNVVAQYGTLTVEPTGKILVVGDATLNCQLLIQQ